MARCPDVAAALGHPRRERRVHHWLFSPFVTTNDVSEVRHVDQHLVRERQQLKVPVGLSPHAVTRPAQASCEEAALHTAREALVPLSQLLKLPVDHDLRS